MEGREKRRKGGKEEETGDLMCHVTLGLGITVSHHLQNGTR